MFGAACSIQHKRRRCWCGRHWRVEATALLRLAVAVSNMQTIGVPTILGLGNTDDAGMDSSEDRERRLLHRLQQLLSDDDDDDDNDGDSDGDGGGDEAEDDVEATQ